MDTNAREMVRTKIESSCLTSETKEIFSVLLEVFDTLLKSKDDIITECNKQIDDLKDHVNLLKND